MAQPFVTRPKSPVSMNKRIPSNAIMTPDFSNVDKRGALYTLFVVLSLILALY